MILLIVINTIICGVLIKTYFMQRNSYENIFQRIEYTNTLVLNLKDVNIEHYNSIYKQLDKANDHLIDIESSLGYQGNLSALERVKELETDD